MSYQQKRTLTSMVTSLLVFGAYCLYAFPRYGFEDSLQAWARTMLIFIGVAALANIVVQIVFHVLLSVGVSVREAIQDHDVDSDRIDAAIRQEIVEDERDKLIALKSRQAGFFISGVGLFAGLVSLVLGATPVLMLNILYGGFFLGAVAEGVVNLVIHRRGVAYG
jgi:hypothetical protein